MGGEDQIKALIRQAFAEKNVADRSVLDVDALLARVMSNVRRLVETLPEESLLRGKAWRDLEPLIKFEMEPYALALQQSIEQQQQIAAPEMETYSQRQLKYAGVAFLASALLTATDRRRIATMVNRAVIGKTRFGQLFGGKSGVSPYTRSMFRVVDRKVRAGMIQELTTEQIADQVVKEVVSRGAAGVSLRGPTATRTIRSQAMAMARTVTADVSRQLMEQSLAADPEAMKGKVAQFFAILDSRTCPVCAAYDGQRWKDFDKAPTTPVHVNCRCRVLMVDPKDPFWGMEDREGLQIRREEYAKGMASKIKVKGEEFYAKKVPFNGDSYSDYLASSNLTTQAEFFGGGNAGMRRARYFRSQIDKVNKDPRDILVSMLNGPADARRFIPIP